MVESAIRRKPGLEQNFSEHRPDKPKLVTEQQPDEQFSESEITPIAPEISPETRTYTVNEPIELMSPDGTVEQWQVESFDPKTNEVFLQRTGDKRTAPSLEVMHAHELALEERSLELAIKLNELWDDVLERYANQPGTAVSSEDFIKKIALIKGNILRTAAIEIIHNHPEVDPESDPEGAERILDRVFAQQLITNAKEKLSGDPRHKEADNLRTLADYFEVLADLREPTNNSEVGDIVDELYEKKLALLYSNRQPDTGLTELSAPIDEVPFGLKATDIEQDTEVVKSQIIRAWENLRDQIKLTKQTLTLTDPTSAQLKGLYGELEHKLREVNQVEALVNELRLRRELEDHPDQDAEFKAWEEMKAKLNLVPKEILYPQEEPINTFKNPQVLKKTKAAGNGRQHLAAPDNRSRLAQGIDKLMSWFGF